MARDTVTVPHVTRVTSTCFSAGMPIEIHINFLMISLQWAYLKSEHAETQAIDVATLVNSPRVVGFSSMIDKQDTRLTSAFKESLSNRA